MTLNRIIREVAGESPSLSYRDVAGYTDPGIVKNALEKIGFQDGDLEALTNQILGKYILEIDSIFNSSKEPFVYPDGERLLEIVTGQGQAVGLMTGNLEAVAWIKLRRFALDRFFSFGVFGEDVNSRMEMPLVAVKRAFEYYSREYGAKQVIIVGDTARDANAASQWGARSVIVCRKPEYRDEIVTAGATWVVSSLDEFVPIA